MASGMTLAQTATESRVLRFPDICEDTIAFVKGGDIYTVPAKKGTWRNCRMPASTRG